MKTALLAVLTAPLLLAQGPCGHRVRHPPSRAAASPPPQIDIAKLPVIEVHPDSLQGIDEATIYHQLCGGEVPRILTRKEIQYPPDHRPWSGHPGVLIVESVIAPDGRIAQVKVLRGPQDEILNRALAEALREWRFTPAKMKGEPVSVYYMLALPVNG